MNVNSRGDLLGGNAGSGVWFTPAGGEAIQLRGSTNGFPAFLDDDTSIFNGDVPGGQVWACTLDGQALPAVDASAGATPLYAANGHWLGFVPGTANSTRTDWLSGLPGAPLGLAPDGTAFVTIAPYPTVQGIAVYPSGARMPIQALFPAQPNLGNFTALDAQRFMWTTGANRLASSGFASQPAQVAEGAYQPTLLDFGASGSVWSVYRTQSGRAIAHPYGDASVGFVLGTNPNGIVAWIGGPGVLMAAWAGNPGEIGQPTVVRVALANAGPFPSTGTAAFTLRPFTHPVTIAVFKDPDGTSGVSDVERDLGVVCEADDAVTIHRVAVDAATAGRRMIWLHDGPEAPQPSVFLPSSALVLLECYRLKAETLEASVQRWRDNLRLMLARWLGDVGIAPMAYCQGGDGVIVPELWTVDEVLDGLRALPELVNQSSRIKVVAPFAWGRANGIIAHDKLRAAFFAIRAASPWPATLRPLEDRPSPSPSPMPTPIPVPSPVPGPAPEVPMPQSQIAFSQKMVGVESQPVLTDCTTVEPHPDGQGLSALAYLDGSGYASYVVIGGAWKKAATAGAGERFTVNGGTITAYRSGQVAMFPAQGIVALA